MIVKDKPSFGFNIWLLSLKNTLQVYMYRISLVAIIDSKVEIQQIKDKDKDKEEG